MVILIGIACLLFGFAVGAIWGYNVCRSEIRSDG